MTPDSRRLTCAPELPQSNGPRCRPPDAGEHFGIVIRGHSTWLSQAAAVTRSVARLW